MRDHLHICLFLLLYLLYISLFCAVCDDNNINFLFVSVFSLFINEIICFRFLIYFFLKTINCVYIFLFVCTKIRNNNCNQFTGKIFSQIKKGMLINKGAAFIPFAVQVHPCDDKQIYVIQSNLISGMRLD